MDLPLLKNDITQFFNVLIFTELEQITITRAASRN